MGGGRAQGLWGAGGAGEQAGGRVYGGMCRAAGGQVEGGVALEDACQLVVSSLRVGPLLAIFVRTCCWAKDTRQQQGGLLEPSLTD